MKLCISFALLALGSGVDAFTTPSSFSPLTTCTTQSTALTSRFPAVQRNAEKATAAAATPCALFTSKQASQNNDNSLSNNQQGNGIRLAMKKVSRFFLLLATALTLFTSGFAASPPAARASSLSASSSIGSIHRTTPVSSVQTKLLTPRQKALRMERLKQQRQQKIQNLTPAQRRKLLQKRQKILQQQQQQTSGSGSSYNAVHTTTAAGYYGQSPQSQQYYYPQQRAAPNHRWTSLAVGSVKLGILAVAVSAAVVIGSKGLAGDLRERLGSLLLAPTSSRSDDNNNNNEVSPNHDTTATARPAAKTTTMTRRQQAEQLPASSGRILPDSDENTAFLVMKKADTTDTNPRDIVIDHDDHHHTNHGVLAYQNNNDNDDDDTHGYYLTHQGPSPPRRDPYMNDQIIPERDGDLAEPFVSPIQMIQPKDDGRKAKATLYRQNQFQGRVPFEQEFELQGDSDTILNHMHASRSREEPSATTVRRAAPGSMLRKSEDDDYYQQLEQQQQQQGSRSNSPQMLGLTRGSSSTSASESLRRPTESLLSRGRTETSQPLAVSKTAYINTATDDSSRHFALSYMFNKFLAKKMRNPAFDSDNATRRITGAAAQKRSGGGFEEDHEQMRRMLP